MRKVRFAAAVLAVLMLAGCMAVLAGCSAGKKEDEAPMTLESYLAESEDGAAELDKINEALTNDNMDGRIEVKENAITMTMTLKQSIDKKYFDKMEGALDDMLTKNDSTFRDAVRSLEEEAQISGVTLEFVLLNADGTEICRKSL